jgi:serine/threonine protein kinase
MKDHRRQRSNSDVHAISAAAHANHAANQKNNSNSNSNNNNNTAPAGRSWGLGMRKSQSDGSGKIFQMPQQHLQPQQQNQTQTHHAHHRATLSSSPLYYNNSIIPEDSPSIPLEYSPSQSTSGSPGGQSSSNTPPKKLWERHYRSFLQRGGSGGNSNNNSNSNSNNNNTKNQLLQHQQQPPTSLPQPPLSTTAGNSSNPKFQQQQEALNPNHHRGSNNNNSNNNNSNNPTGSEGSVRGGSFFSSVFSRGNNNNSHDSSGSNHANGSQNGSHGQTHRRKAKSLSLTNGDELDGTMRRGAEKSYSPGSRSYKTMTIAASESSTSNSTSTTGVPMIPAIMKTAAATKTHKSTNSLVMMQGQVGPLPPHKSTNSLAMMQVGPLQPPPLPQSRSATLQRGSSVGNTRQRASTCEESLEFMMIPRHAQQAQAQGQAFHNMSRKIMSSQQATLAVAAAEASGLMRMPRQQATLAVAEAEAQAQSQDFYVGTPVTELPKPRTQSPPPTLDNNRSNDSLDLSRSSSSSSMKKAFTAFHNAAETGRDSGHAYLGDDPSEVDTQGQDKDYYVEPTLAPAAAAASKSATTALPKPRTQSPPPPTLDTGSDSLDLSRSSSAMKKAFTAFHNAAETGQDSGHAYLGDDPSHSRGQNLFWAPIQQRVAAPSSLQQSLAQYNSMSSSSAAAYRYGGSNSHGNLKSHFNVSSPSLETVQESVVPLKTTRILKPILGVDSWSNGRRYLVAPAALAACPVTVLTTMSGSADVLNAAEGASHKSPFGTIVLGEAVLSYVGGTSGGQYNHLNLSNSNISTGKSQIVQRWSSACLVLRQNYLLEYDSLSAVRGMPRGFCHLQHAVCHDHQDFPDALELHFYASPCAKADKRVLMIRVQQRGEREHWKTCLNRAAALELNDLYAYDVQNPLGQGQYASVYAARRQNSGSEEENNGGKNKHPAYNCALKIFDKKEFWRLVVKGRERADTLVRETSVQSTLTAKCGRVASFLKLRGFFETSDNVVLELELLEGTDLFKYISSKGVLGEDEAGRILIDILKSLEAMNRIGLAHRDIKPANVLMCHTGQQGPAAKVGDFGMSTFVDVDGQVRGRCGTPGYVAPEIFTAGVHGGYGNKVDVFSAGVTLYVMLCGYEPFYGETDAELVAANKAAQVEFTEADWDSISFNAQDMVKKMMHPDPKKRMDAKAALQHPWLRRLDKDSDVLDLSMTLPSHEAPTEDACVIS